MNGDAAAVETKKASYGSTVVIDCKTELESPVKYSWNKQGGQLSKNAEIRDVSNFHISNLISLDIFNNLIWVYVSISCFINTCS